jgi:hypothetical protein
MLYLGSKITYDGKSVHEIKQRITLAKIAFNKKHKLLTSKKNTSQYQEETYKNIRMECCNIWM